MKKEIVPFLIDKIETGGAEKVILRIAGYFKDRIEPHVFTSVNSNGLGNFDLSQVIVHNSTTKPSSNYIWKIYSIVKQIITLIFFVRKYKCKKIVSFLERSNFVCVVTAKLMGVESIVSIRNNIEYQYSTESWLKGVVSTFVLKKIYSNADIVIALSKGVGKQLVSKYSLPERKVRTIYNPYPISDIYKKSLEENPKTEGFLNQIGSKYFITAGRLSVQKDHKVLLSCFNEYRLKGGKNCLVIIGDGELRAKLSKMIVDLQLTKCVFMLGFRNDALNLIANADAFLFTSRYEGFGNACLEAMAVGTYIISSDCDFGPREILGINDSSIYPIKTQCGILTSKLDSRDPSSISEFVSAMQDCKERSKHKKVDSYNQAMCFDESIILNSWDSALLN